MTIFDCVGSAVGQTKEKHHNTKTEHNVNKTTSFQVSN